jgi:hypothetical protein
MATHQQLAHLYGTLVTLARTGKTTTYSEVAPIVNLDVSEQPDRNELGELLGYISRAEVMQQRPMLSAIGLHKGDASVGTGFYKLGVELGRARPNQEDFEFLAMELKALQAFWSGRGR